MKSFFFFVFCISFFVIHVGLYAADAPRADRRLVRADAAAPGARGFLGSLYASAWEWATPDSVCEQYMTSGEFGRRSEKEKCDLFGEALHNLVSAKMIKGAENQKRRIVRLCRLITFDRAFFARYSAQEPSIIKGFVDDFCWIHRQVQSMLTNLDEIHQKLVEVLPVEVQESQTREFASADDADK